MLHKGDWFGYYDRKNSKPHPLNWLKFTGGLTVRDDPFSFPASAWELSKSQAVGPAFRTSGGDRLDRYDIL